MVVPMRLSAVPAVRRAGLWMVYQACCTFISEWNVMVVSMCLLVVQDHIDARWCMEAGYGFFWGTQSHVVMPEREHHQN